MNRATRLTVSAFGVLAAIAGIEHGVGEMLQGNRAPGSLVIESWPDSELFRILGGEPAMTVVPNLLITGMLAIVTSLVFLAWVTLFIEREHGGAMLILISIAMLLVGAGFGPPLLGIILGITATRINAPLDWWRTHLTEPAARLLGDLWPWSLSAGMAAWLLLFPGSLLIGRVIGTGTGAATLVTIIMFTAVGTLFLTILAGLARDSRRERPINPHVSLDPAMMGDTNV
jgi:hypothetical protein